MKKIDKRKLSRKKEEAICKLYSDGKTYLDIAMQLQVSDNTIRKVLIRNKIKARKGGGSNIKIPLIKKSEIIATLNNTSSVAEAARILNIAQNTLYNYISKLGIYKSVKILWKIKED